MPTLESFLPTREETITITRYLTKRERISRGKDTLIRMILMNFYRGDTVWFRSHQGRYRLHFSNNGMIVNHGKLNIQENFDQDRFKKFLLAFDIITLMRILKMISKNHLDKHAQNKQTLKISSTNEETI